MATAGNLAGNALTFRDRPSNAPERPVIQLPARDCVSWWCDLPLQFRRDIKYAVEMLHAIINGKAGALTSDVSEGQTWRHAYRASEDLLTAATFERLAYLSGARLWQILASTFHSGGLPQRKVAELLDIEFWPFWQDATEKLGQAVEPDVVLTFSIGDPAQIAVLIVECKAGGGLQYPDQWAREWTAFDARCATTERPDEVWLLALGGVPEGPAQTTKSFTERIRKAWGLEIRAVAADWTDLARAVEEIGASSVMEARVLRDIALALDLHGYRNVRPMQEIVAVASRYPVSAASAATLRIVRRETSRQTEVAPTRAGASGRAKSMDELIKFSTEYRTNPRSMITLKGLQ